MQSILGNACGFLEGRPVRGIEAAGEEGIYRAYELRMDALVTHPLFESRLRYPRLLEVQARLLAKLLDREIAEFPVFVAR